MTRFDELPANARGVVGAEPIDTLCVNTLRTLSCDAVQQAQSGHPGTPMALAPVIYTIWQRFLRYDPASPAWPNRDRFVLSCGHASALLYAMLHLAGVRGVDAEPGRPAGTGAWSTTLAPLRLSRWWRRASSAPRPCRTYREAHAAACRPGHGAGHRHGHHD